MLIDAKATQFHSLEKNVLNILYMLLVTTSENCKLLNEIFLKLKIFASSDGVAPRTPFSLVIFLNFYSLNMENSYKIIFSE